MNIWCVGRNYSDHARELGNAVPEEPIVFLKSGDSVQNHNQYLFKSKSVLSLHHELELAFEFDADLQLSSWTLAIDFTDRVRQNQLKEKVWPWTLAKSFRGATYLSPQKFPLADHKNWPEVPFSLAVNGQLRQQGSGSSMIFGLATMREYFLRHFPVQPGDWFLSGTPAGVGALELEDVVELRLGDFLCHKLQVIEMPTEKK